MLDDPNGGSEEGAMVVERYGYSRDNAIGNFGDVHKIQNLVLLLKQFIIGGPGPI